jgi:hypothetical protein
LAYQFERLSQLEREAIAVFASQPKAISILELIEVMKISTIDGCDTTESLMRRGLISSIETNNGMVFKLDSIISH